MIKRALVVGVGSIGSRHLRLLREALPFADIRVLRHSACTESLAGADGCFDNLKAACAFAPEAAVISNPAPFHLASATALARVGAHILVEKPISDSVAGVRELLAFCSDNALVLQVGYNLRFSPVLQRFKAEIDSGTIGSVYCVQCEVGQYLPSWRPSSDYRTGVSARSALGGGVLLELSHEFDMLRWVFGEVAWLSAWTGRVSQMDVDVEDSAMLQMGFANGAVAQLSMDFVRRDTSRRCTAIGELGNISWDGVAGTVSEFNPEARAWRKILASRQERDATYSAQLSAFLSAIAREKQDVVAASGNDGLSVIRMVEAARRSNAEGGRRICLNGVE